MLAGRKETGFTLVEVMVSLVIFMVASMGLLPLLLTNMQASRELGLHTQARQLASEVMAELQVVDYDSLQSRSEQRLLVGEIDIWQQIDRDEPLNGQSRITVTTHWQQQGRDHRYQLQSIRTAP